MQAKSVASILYTLNIAIEPPVFIGLSIVVAVVDNAVGDDSQINSILCCFFVWIDRERFQWWDLCVHAYRILINL